MSKPKVTSLSAALSKKPQFEKFSTWIVGDTPLITHAWSQKARLEILQKQVKATKSGKEPRNPEQDFINSLYEMTDGVYGFPVTGVKDCILDAAHKDRGIPRTAAMRALWLNAEMVRVRPALKGAICDMPLVRIYGTQPEMREDMVRIGAGMNKTANLSYRGQFTVWAIRITGETNPTILTEEALAFLVQWSGKSCGIGEWRNEKSGMFGRFHLATLAEEKAWDKYAAGKGKLPVPVPESDAAPLPMAAE